MRPQIPGEAALPGRSMAQRRALRQPGAGRNCALCGRSFFLIVRSLSLAASMEAVSFGGVARPTHHGTCAAKRPKPKQWRARNGAGRSCAKHWTEERRAMAKTGMKGWWLLGGLLVGAGCAHSTNTETRLTKADEGPYRIGREDV